MAKAPATDVDLTDEPTRPDPDAHVEPRRSAHGGVVTEGNEPIALASLRTYPRTLRVFVNWLPKATR